MNPFRVLQSIKSDYRQAVEGTQVIKDKEGPRVLGTSGQQIVAAGTVVGQRKQGEAVEWAVLVDEINAVRKFLSPPASIRRLPEDQC